MNIILLHPSDVREVRVNLAMRRALVLAIAVEQQKQPMQTFILHCYDIAPYKAKKVEPKRPQWEKKPRRLDLHRAAKSKLR